MEVRFSIDNPKFDKRVKKRGEDAPPVSKQGIMIVCDGTGATGMSEHEIDGEKYTSAYLGSRKTSEIAEKFLLEHYKEMMDSFNELEDIEAVTHKLGRAIRDGLLRYKEEKNLQLTVRGKSFRLLPTTFTAVVYKICEDGVKAIVLCAGDSRALWWDINGLHQLSSDDSGTEADISVGDCKIDNCVSADLGFHISFLQHKLPKQGILLVTSDGFTDPIRPFEQEEYLLKWIDEFKEITEERAEELSTHILNKIDEAGFHKYDDCTMSGVIVGYTSDKELRDDIQERCRKLRSEYIEPYRIREQDRKAIATKLEREPRDFQKIIDEAEKKEMDLKEEYLEFLKKVGKETGKSIYTFDIDVLRALNKIMYYDDERNKYNNAKSEAIKILQKFPEIMEEDLDNLDAFRDKNEKARESYQEWNKCKVNVSDMMKAMSALENFIKNDNNGKTKNEKIIETFFSFDNAKIDGYYQEDFKSRFSRFNWNKSFEDDRKVMEIQYDKITQLKNSIDEEKLELQRQLKESIKNREEIWNKYSIQYEKYLRSSKANRVNIEAKKQQIQSR